MTDSTNFTDDSIQAGIQKVLGATVIPFIDPQGKVWFRVAEGNDETLSKLYANNKVGALEVMTAVKAMRQAIFVLKKTKRGGDYHVKQYSV